MLVALQKTSRTSLLHRSAELFCFSFELLRVPVLGELTDGFYALGSA